MKVQNTYTHTSKKMNRGYITRLQTLVSGAMLNASEDKNRPTSYRELAEKLGFPSSYKSLHLWNGGTIKQPLRSPSYPLLLKVAQTAWQFSQVETVDQVLHFLESGEKPEQALTRKIDRLLKELEGHAAFKRGIGGDIAETDMIAA